MFRLQRQPRPLWRVLGGLAHLGGGALMVGFGASALSVNGQCDLEAVAGSCSGRYSTLAPGAVFVGVGAFALAGGIALVAIPGPLRKVQGALSPGVLMGRSAGLSLGPGLRF